MNLAVIVTRNIRDLERMERFPATIHVVLADNVIVNEVLSFYWKMSQRERVERTAISGLQLMA